MLGVRAETLAAHGAVSEATAREMAAGALARSGADIAVAVTGHCRAGGGLARRSRSGSSVSRGRAVAVAVDARTLHFAGDRAAVRAAAVAAALEGLISRASAP